MTNRAHDSLSIWTEEAGRDSRNIRWAIIAAVAVHILVFRLQLPETATAEPGAKTRPVHVLRPPRFEPPPVNEQKQIPERRALRVPVPDPTPDDPEPLVTVTEIAPTLDLPDADFGLILPSAPPPDRPAGLRRVGGDVLPPVKRYAPPPQYTEIARKARIQGVVIVEAVIDATGNVSRVKLIKSLPMGLDQSAMNTVKTWRFEPATCNGKPVAVLYNLTINFRLT